MRFNNEITLGAVIQVATVVGVCVIFIVRGSDSAESSRTQISEIKTQVARDIGELKGLVKEGLDGLGRQVATLPDIAAKIAQMERRQDNADQTVNRLDGRVGTVERMAIETHADMAAIHKADGLALGQVKVR